MTATVFLAIPMKESGFLDRQPDLKPAPDHAAGDGYGHDRYAVLTERVAYRPLRKAPRLVPLDHCHRRILLLAVLLPRPIWLPGYCLPENRSPEGQHSLPGNVRS